MRVYGRNIGRVLGGHVCRQEQPGMKRVSGLDGKEFMARLNEAICSSGLTHRELSEMCGIGRSQISKWASGETVPNGRSIAAICQALGVSSDWLLGLDGPDNEAAEACNWRWDDGYMVWVTDCGIELTDADNNELSGEYEATHCPWCGRRIAGDGSDMGRESANEKRGLMREYLDSVLPCSAR